MKNNFIQKTKTPITGKTAGNIQKYTGSARNLFYNKRYRIINDLDEKKLSLSVEPFLKSSLNNAFKSIPNISNDAAGSQASYSIAPADLFVQEVPHSLKFSL